MVVKMVERFVTTCNAPSSSYLARASIIAPVALAACLWKICTTIARIFGRFSFMRLPVLHNSCRYTVAAIPGEYISMKSWLLRTYSCGSSTHSSSSSALKHNTGNMTRWNKSSRCGCKPCTWTGRRARRHVLNGEVDDAIGHHLARRERSQELGVHSQKHRRVFRRVRHRQTFVSRFTRLWIAVAVEDAIHHVERPLLRLPPRPVLELRLIRRRHPLRRHLGRDDGVKREHPLLKRPFLGQRRSASMRRAPITSYRWPFSNPPTRRSAALHTPTASLKSPTILETPL